MAFTGVRGSGAAQHSVVAGYSSAAVTAAQILTEQVVVCYGRIGGIVANAVTAGSGAGNTVLDVLVNGTSIYTVTADRPTLAAASTGLFTNGQAQLRALKPGDVVRLIALTIPATTGHARVSLSVGIEKA